MVLVFSLEQECPAAVIIVAPEGQRNWQLSCLAIALPELEDHTNGSSKTYSIGGLTDVLPTCKPAMNTRYRLSLLQLRRKIISLPLRALCRRRAYCKIAQENRKEVILMKMLLSPLITQIGLLYMNRKHRQFNQILGKELDCHSSYRLHFGPRTFAKPIIDIMPVVAHIEAVDPPALGSLKHLAMEVNGESGIPGRRYFRKGGNNSAPIKSIFSNNPTNTIS